MSRAHPAMAAAVERYGYRGVLVYHEELLRTSLASAFADATDLDRPLSKLVPVEKLNALARARGIAIDVWNVDHYVVTGLDTKGVVTHRVVRHAKRDGRITVFETVGFDQGTIVAAVVLAGYATASELRRSYIDAAINSRMKPGLIAANRPDVRAGWRRLTALSNAAVLSLIHISEPTRPY